MEICIFFQCTSHLTQNVSQSVRPTQQHGLHCTAHVSVSGARLLVRTWKKNVLTLNSGFCLHTYRHGCTENCLWKTAVDQFFPRTLMTVTSPRAFAPEGTHVVFNESDHASQRLKSAAIRCFADIIYSSGQSKFIRGQSPPLHIHFLEVSPLPVLLTSWRIILGKCT